MSEWTVVTAIIALVGLLTAVVKPLISLNGTITRLTEAVSRLQDNISELTDRNSEGHSRLWLKSGEHDEKLGAHETRLRILEEK